VRDLASRNGVYVNGHLVGEGRLRHGDLLCVGPFAFWWICTPPPGPRPRHLNEEENRRTPMLAVIGEKAPRFMDSQTFLIGSREDCDLVLRQPMVETAHAVIYRWAGAFHLRDLNSKSGTHVNGRPVRQTALRTGDELRIGLTRIRFDEAEREEPGEQGEPLTGFSGIANTDRALVDAVREASCPTIEQLLGAAPQRITCWEQGRLQTLA
jgi:pSer/pThr/pTyr-binding forkhead associated (FHA) protein